jgi:MFS family permease
MPYTVLMPVFADAILHGGAKGLGILMGATGVGALLGALTLANRTGLKGLGTWAASAAGGFGIGLILFSLSRWFWLSVILLVATGFCMMLQMACTNTLLQSMVPDRLRGRVMALYSMMFIGMAPFGALFAGLVASRLGAPITVVTGGAVCVLGAGMFASRLPRLRGEARQLILAQRMVAAEPPEEMIARGAPGGGG